MRLYHKRLTSIVLLLSVTFLTACGPALQTPGLETSAETAKEQDSDHISISGLPITEYQVVPETFSLSVKQGQTYHTVSLPVDAAPVEDYRQTDGETAWNYPDLGLDVSLSLKEDYLSVNITSTDATDNEFSWPYVSGDSYYLPLGEGKRIPADDQLWNNYLRSMDISVMEQLSMPFLVSVTGDYSVVIIMEQPFRSSLIFDDSLPSSFVVRHQYPEIDKDRSQKFRIYLTDSSPVSAAKLYQQYVKEQGRFRTLEEKAQDNPDIRKLYGAPHIYLWGDWVISPEDINWKAFRENLPTPVGIYLKEQFIEAEDGKEAITAMEEMASQDYVAQYQQHAICRALSQVLKQNSFYDETIMPNKDQTMERLLNKGIETLTPPEMMTFNQHALAASWPDVVKPVEHWMESGTTDIIDSMEQAGIDNAWIGLNSWEQAYAKPELAEAAAKAGYLIGPYDSYHSIHEPGKEQWITASFEDHKLYYDAAVMDQKGNYLSGFQNVGRKLNPILSLPSVTQRLDEITGTGIPFNSWFIDCDATGEIYDDYSPGHPNTMKEDLNARLKRMGMIRDQYHMVIGSEGGNDFAAYDIAFAHGIELPSFSWMDEDMKSNKDSPYYMGKYYNPTGGVAERFAKPIPVKDTYRNLFLNPYYDVPLYKLVYNRSVVTTYHWDWSTLKIQGAENQRMMREILFNVPPLYHLDQEQWEQYEQIITSHTGVWSEFSRKAVMQEMTDFQYVTEDGMVQMTQYGSSVKVVANYGDEAVQYEGDEVPGGSVLMIEGEKKTCYTPSIS